MTYNPPGYNQMLTDFGMYFHEMIKPNIFKPESTMSNLHIKKKLEEIDNSFNLILLADDEYYEEGMVLLKHALCWDYEDIINVPRNAFYEKKESYFSEQAKTIVKSIEQHVNINFIIQMALTDYKIDLH